MTLKEKLFDVVFDNAYEFKTENVLPELVDITDDFAIGFAEFLINYNFHPTYKVWIKHSSLSNEKCSTKQLLEIYKKEKGL